MWGRIVDHFLIDPYYFDSHLNDNKCLEFLNNTLPELLDYVPDNIKHAMWYQHDSARNIFKLTIVGSVMACESPDLTIMVYGVLLIRIAYLKQSLLHKRQ